MEITEKKPLNIGGLLVLFIVFAVVGTVLSYAYLGLIDSVASVYPSIIFAAAYGGLMYGLVYTAKQKLKITNSIGTVAAVVLAAVVVNYFKWQIFFGVWYVRFSGFDLAFTEVRYVMDMLRVMIRFPFENDINPVVEFFNDLRLFNYHGTWSMDGGNAVTGIPLWAIWAGELVIMFGIPLAAAVKPVGVLLNSHGKFALPQYFTYSFEPFSDEQAETLLSDYGDINTIVNQPLTSQQLTLTTDKNGVLLINKNKPGKVGLVAQLYIGDTPTEYILLTNTKSRTWGLDRLTGKWFAPIPLGLEKIEMLRQELVKLHGPLESDPNYDENEYTDDDLPDEEPQEENILPEEEQPYE